MVNFRLYCQNEVKNMSKLDAVKKHLRPGQVYRRAEFSQWSNAVDRHLRQLQENGMLTKLSSGLYYCPKKTTFGDAPANDVMLVKAFLKDHRFLINSPNTYNTLGVGTTQLYNETVVYNHKRHGLFKLGARYFDFRIKPHFPQSLSKEFLLVDLVNNVDRLAEDREIILQKIKEKFSTTDMCVLHRMVRKYGNLHTKKFFNHMKTDDINHAA